jgi:hypothetical protein
VHRAVLEDEASSTARFTVMDDAGVRAEEQPEITEKLVYSADPLASLLLDMLGLGPGGMALAAMAWGVLYALALPAIFGSLRSGDGYLGSLGDWHAQLLLFLVFPAACAFYAWQPRGIAGVYRAMDLRWGLLEVGAGYRRRVWLVLAVCVAITVVAFDAAKMVVGYGSWWMTENWASIVGREASLALGFYVLAMIAGRQFVASLEWRRMLSTRFAASGLRAASSYGLSWTLLMALLGLRLSVEAIELPRRVGAITPDYYAKIALYLVVGVFCFWFPLSGSLRKDHGLGLDWLVPGLEVVGILSLPLLGFVVLSFLFGA